MSLNPETFRSLDLKPTPKEAVPEKKYSSNDRLNNIINSKVGLVFSSFPKVAPFDPQQRLAEIRKLPKESKKSAITEFKAQLNSRAEALSYTRVIIEDLINLNPNIELQTLQMLLQDVCSQYGILPEIEKNYQEVLSNFDLVRRDIKQVRQNFPDDLKLTELLLNKANLALPSLEVRVTPYNIQILVDTPGYFILTGKTEQQQRGYSIISKQLPQIQNRRIPVVVINQDPELNPKNVLKNIIHEEEHSITKIFNNQVATGDLFLSIERGSAENIYQLLISRTDPSIPKDYEKIREALYIYLKDFQNYALERARKELISFKKEGSKSSPQKILEAYGYFESTSLNKIRNILASKPELNHLLKMVELVRAKISREVFEASKSFDMLVSKEYDPNQVIALLSFTPLKYWSREIRRVIQQIEL